MVPDSNVSVAGVALVDGRRFEAGRNDRVLSRLGGLLLPMDQGRVLDLHGGVVVVLQVLEETLRVADGFGVGVGGFADLDDRLVGHGLVLPLRRVVYQGPGGCGRSNPPWTRSP